VTLTGPSTNPAVWGPPNAPTSKTYFGLFRIGFHSSNRRHILNPRYETWEKLPWELHVLATCRHPAGCLRERFPCCARSSFC
jgi:hypothetical protein